MSKISRNYEIARTGESFLKRRNYSNSVVGLEPCGYCGLSGIHPKCKDCPAYGKICYKCHRMDHFAGVCRARRYKDRTNYWSGIGIRQKNAKKQEFYRKQGSDDESVSHTVGHLRIKTVKMSEENQENIFNDKELVTEGINLETDDTQNTIKRLQSPNLMPEDPRSAMLNKDQQRSI